MRHGKKPTREQRKVIERNNLDTYDCLIIKVFADGFLCTIPSTDKTIRLYQDKKGLFTEDGNAII